MIEVAHVDKLAEDCGREQHLERLSVLLHAVHEAQTAEGVQLDFVLRAKLLLGVF
jgi:hypothetical protein